MRPELAFGSASSAGPKPRNEDALACITPSEAASAAKGALFVLCDGVSDCADGQLAARASVRALASDYYATPDTWEVGAALDKLLEAHNRWLRSQGQTLLSTLTALVLRGRRYTIAHVGDCRLYRLSAGRLQCLTQDHVWPESSLRHVLKRALGLDEHLVVDYRDGDTQAGDVFALLTDGVWGVLADIDIDRLLRLHVEPQRAAEALLEAAAGAGLRDNASAIVVRVDALPDEHLHDEFARPLAVPPRLKPGMQLEGLTVEALLSDSPQSLAYRVRDAAGAQWVLKTLPPILADDGEATRRLLREEWLQKRLSGPYFAEVKPLPQREHLYYLTRWYEGETLAQRGTESVDEALAIALALTRALGQLHRLNVVHRDVKPDNIHLGRDGRLRLLDLGAAYCPGVDEAGAFTPGTPSFMAPELFDGQPAARESDLYAAGVTLYWLLTGGHYPYGEVEAFQRPVFGEAAPPSRYRPDLPPWLENLLLKAVEREPGRRFETAEEMQLALERGEAMPLSRRQVPWAERAPLKLWRGLALASLLLNLALLYALLHG